VLEATTSDTLPAVALIIQTTSSGAAIFFNVLFQGQLFESVCLPSTLPW
jgi:hypothetical protein